MRCSHCGAVLPYRPRARSIMTGLIFIITAFVLVFFVHLAVAVVAAVLLTVVGAGAIRSALHPSRCRICGRH